MASRLRPPVLSPQLPDEWVLVTAAAGGVGIAAVQLAKCVSTIVMLWRMHENDHVSSIALGARVIAAAGSEAKLDIAKRYGGADYGVNYSNAGWQKEVLKLTNGKGVDVIYDPVGLIAGRSMFPPDRCCLNQLFAVRLFEMYCLERSGSSYRICRRDN